MSGKSYSSLIEAFDASPMGVRYWLAFAVITLGQVLEFFDIFIVGFLVAKIAPQWHLTYLQSSIMLLSAGVGSIVGGLYLGVLADRFGRRPLVILSYIICAVSSGSIALIPNHAWWIFAVLRFGVGFGLAAGATVGLTLLVEFTPTRWRTLIAGFPTVASTCGTFVASATAATLINVLGWRGVAALGAAPLVVALIGFFCLPESLRWLISKGRQAEARNLVAELHGVPASSLPLPQTPSSTRRPPVGLSELYSMPGRFWFTIFAWLGAATADYGVYLWGPTVVALMLGLNVSQAAQWFVLVAACGVVGKVVFALLPTWIGRRRTGMLHGYGIAVSLSAAAFFHLGYVMGVPIFVLLLAVGAFFFDGGFSNLMPYTVEMFPVSTAARGLGLGEAANGVGKILGPLCLALMAGANNLVSPAATAGAVFPAFIFLAAAGLVVGLAFTISRWEMHGKAMDLGYEDKEEGETTAALVEAHR